MDERTNVTRPPMSLSPSPSPIPVDDIDPEIDPDNAVVRGSYTDNDDDDNDDLEKDGNDTNADKNRNRNIADATKSNALQLDDFTFKSQSWVYVFLILDHMLHVPLKNWVLRFYSCNKKIKKKTHTCILPLCNFHFDVRTSKHHNKNNTKFLFDWKFGLFRFSIVFFYVVVFSFIMNTADTQQQQQKHKQMDTKWNTYRAHNAHVTCVTTIIHLNAYLEAETDCFSIVILLLHRRWFLIAPHYSRCKFINLMK